MLIFTNAHLSISGVLWKILMRFAKFCKNSAFLLFIEIYCWIVLILNSGWLLFHTFSKHSEFLIPFICLPPLSSTLKNSMLFQLFSWEEGTQIIWWNRHSFRKRHYCNPQILFASFLLFHSTFMVQKRVMIRSLLGSNKQLKAPDPRTESDDNTKAETVTFGWLLWKSSVIAKFCHIITQISGLYMSRMKLLCSCTDLSYTLLPFSSTLLKMSLSPFSSLFVNFVLHSSSIIWRHHRTKGEVFSHMKSWLKNRHRRTGINGWSFLLHIAGCPLSSRLSTLGFLGSSSCPKTYAQTLQATKTFSCASFPFFCEPLLLICLIFVSFADELMAFFYFFFLPLPPHHQKCRELISFVFPLLITME